MRTALLATILLFTTQIIKVQTGTTVLRLKDTEIQMPNNISSYSWRQFAKDEEDYKGKRFPH